MDKLQDRSYKIEIPEGQLERGTSEISESECKEKDGILLRNIEWNFLMVLGYFASSNLHSSPLNHILNSYFLKTHTTHIFNRMISCFCLDKIRLYNNPNSKQA